MDNDVTAASVPADDSPEFFEGTLMDGLENEPPYPPAATTSRLGPPPVWRGNSNMEYAAPGMNAWAAKAWEELQQLRECLVRIAEVAGEDGEAVDAARSGALVNPSLSEFAFQAVLRLQLDYAEFLNGE